ncbi:HEPN domain-containing protein [Lacrimispora sp.]|uniref:HEPN domain-containing protein n=1 Tax=Lacrimispora sp. TaxID=2719234 RepID=UPI00268EE3CD|nr:HEPN domain-containing protein [Lacrimispora sp.]
MVFSKHIFDEFSETEIFRDKMELSDPEFEYFDFISTNPMIKKEFREDYSEKEYIASYLQAAKELCASIKRPVGIKIIINRYSLALPIIYLCRHCVELAIKYHTRKYLKKSPRKDHKIEDLWNELKKDMPNGQTDQEVKILEDMSRFISCILSVDKSGTMLRYSKQKDKYSQEKLTFANVNRIVELTDKFVKQLEAIAEK